MHPFNLTGPVTFSQPPSALPAPIPCSSGRTVGGGENHAQFVLGRQRCLLLSPPGPWRGIQPQRMAEPRCGGRAGTVTPNEPRTATMPGIPASPDPTNLPMAALAATRRTVRICQLSTTLGHDPRSRHPDVTRAQDRAAPDGRCLLGVTWPSKPSHQAHYEGTTTSSSEV